VFLSWCVINPLPVRKLNRIVAMKQFQHNFRGNVVVKSFLRNIFRKKNFPIPRKSSKIVKYDTLCSNPELWNNPEQPLEQKRRIMTNYFVQLKFWKTPLDTRISSFFVEIILFWLYHTLLLEYQFTFFFPLPHRDTLYHSIVVFYNEQCFAVLFYHFSWSFLVNSDFETQLDHIAQKWTDLELIFPTYDLINFSQCLVTCCHQLIQIDLCLLPLLMMDTG
jgi:hypothetical protein